MILGKMCSKIFLLAVLLLLVNTSLAQEKTGESEKPKVNAQQVKKGRPPVIIIPGLIGSELINKSTGDKVWFDLGRAKDDDMRLPISANLASNKDNLVPGDILRDIQLIRFTPKIDIYKKFLESMVKDGYTEGKIDDPPADGFSDTFYVFAYDWRLDNVENAANLLKKLDNLKTKFDRSDLKFDIVAHSMGGLITRYALMYGTADINSGKLRPDWAGAGYFNTIMLVATPNGGSLPALDSLINGFSLFGSGKINLPFVQNLSKFDLFSIPSIYQLLPHDGMVRAFDENLKPLQIDVYDPETWEKYGWIAYQDKNFAEKYSAEENLNAKNYFYAVLKRAKDFQSALRAKPVKKNPVPIYYLGSECKPTVDGMIIYREKDAWKTKFEPETFTRSDGTKVTKEELEKILLSPGDGVVSKRSLIASLRTVGKLGNPRSGLVNDLTIACGEHNRLTGEESIDRSLLSVLNLSLKKIGNPNK